MLVRSFVRLRGPVTVGAVWLAYALALAASFQHVRRAFGALEPSPGSLTGYAAAAAVEVGLAALALALVARRREGAADGRLWAGLAAMACVSALANADAALTALGAGHRPLWGAGLTVDPLDVARAIIGAATLPALVLFLAAAAETLTGAATLPELVPTAGDDAAPARVGAPVRRGARAVLDDATRRPLRPTTAAHLDRLLAVMAQHPTATRRTLADHAGVSVHTLRRLIERGTALGVLSRVDGTWRTHAGAVSAPAAPSRGATDAADLPNLGA